MRTMDGDVTGYAEPGVAAYDPDDVLQFERVGFVRVDAPPADGDGLLAYYAHQ
jgi:glutamyl-tRNA synthetase